MLLPHPSPTQSPGANGAGGLSSALCLPEHQHDVFGELCPLCMDGLRASPLEVFALVEQLHNSTANQFNYKALNTSPKRRCGEGMS